MHYSRVESSAYEWIYLGSKVETVLINKGYSEERKEGDNARKEDRKTGINFYEDNERRKREKRVRKKVKRMNYKSNGRTKRKGKN